MNWTKLVFFVILSFLLNKNSIGQNLIEVQPSEIQDLFSRYKGKRAILVNIWATWCGPCIEEFPYILELSKKYEDQIQTILISGDFEQDKERVIRFLTDQEVWFDTYLRLGSDSEFVEAIHDDWSGALPFTLLLNKKGEIVSYWENKADLSKFESEINKAIQE